MELILDWDVSVLIFINETIQNGFFDFIMPLLRNRYIWLPVYIWLITFILTNYNLEKASYIILFIISSVVITDIVSGQILKKYVQRPRPCNESSLAIHLEPRIHCSHSYSFPSSHAANHFGLATILTGLFGYKNRLLKYVLFTWAGIISFAQIYVGVHFPLDIFVGSKLGVVLVKIYLNMFSPIIQNNELLETNIDSH